jgi:hypothetical protein
VSTAADAGFCMTVTVPTEGVVANDMTSEKINS